MAFVFAIELQDQVEKYGVYVGLAAFFGLAVLTVLYFAQARELKRLREWAGRAPERALELEQRLAGQAAVAQAPGPVRSQPIAAPVPAAGASVVRRGTTVHPAAAAIPLAANAGAAPTIAAPVTATATTAAVAAPAVSGGAQAPAPPEPPSPKPGGDAASAPPNGAPAAGEIRLADRPAPPPPPAPVLPKPATAAAAPLRAGLPPARRPVTSAASTSARRPGAAGSPGRSRRSGALVVGLIVAALAGVVFLGTRFIGGDNEPPTTGNQVEEGPAASPTAAGSAGSANPPRSVASTRKVTTVAVLNGTQTPGLAANLLERLSGSGYAEGGKTGNAPEQSISTTTVYFAEGQRRQAADAARIIGGADLKPMDSATQALAGPNAKLLVIAGSDKAP